jgi:hypothetical protein
VTRGGEAEATPREWGLARTGRFRGG